jgi:4'-phosphopantetheinyl transferase
MTLFPVVMPLSEAGHKLSGTEQAIRLSRLAREALMVSAERSRVRLGELPVDENGRPCPVSGNHWSVSHKPRCVAAVVSKERIGLDVEEISPRSASLFDYVATEEEWQLQEKSWDTFFRYWTAKEATLKAVGVGIAGGMKNCRAISVPDADHIILEYRGASFLVEQLRYEDHLVAVVKGDNRIEWVVVRDPQY